ncbi:hypothetical protein [Saccharolobus islandicus]|uniref:hypothetical protein n=1 Tax=Saccharolobus islandicus TaxID=43080 RepID=UPI000A73480B|nr:hypothetical protein [Sulfolobus islandicus]
MTKWVFIPIIKGVNYEIKIDNNANVIGFNINNVSLQLADQNNYYVNINHGRVTGFNNVFVLFGAIACLSNNKIKIKLTLNPCDYIRGFVIPLDDNSLSNLRNIFDINNNSSCVSINPKSFAILNKRGNINMTEVSVCLEHANNVVAVHNGDTRLENIENVQSIIIRVNDNPITITDNNILRIFRYSTTQDGQC